MAVSMEAGMILLSKPLKVLEQSSTSEDPVRDSLGRILLVVKEPHLFSCLAAISNQALETNTWQLLRLYMLMSMQQCQVFWLTPFHRTLKIQI